MTFPRASGILLHPTSLPGPHGVGDLGPEAYRFLEFLHAAGHKLWQVLPLNPTGYGDSPFQCFSASAGNPLLLNLDRFIEKGILSKTDLAGSPVWPLESVDFGRVIAYKTPLLKKAARHFLETATSNDRGSFETFCRSNAGWLDDFALFMAVKDAHDLVAWTRWPADIASRKPEALREWSGRLAREIEAIKYWQFEFTQQWQSLRDYARERNIRIIGDIPIYVAHDSADVWANREFFWLDAGRECFQDLGCPSRLLQRDRATLGQSDLQLGTPQRDELQLVGRSLPRRDAPLRHHAH